MSSPSTSENEVPIKSKLYDTQASAVEMENVDTIEHIGDVNIDDAAALRGAEIIEEERTMTLIAAARRYWKVIIICLSSFTAGMVFGYDTLVNGAAISMPAFLLYFGEMGPTGPYLPSIWTSLWTAMSSLSQVLGGIAVGTITDRFGRRYPAVAAGALTMAGTAMQYKAESRGLLLAGKMLNGFGIGAALASATTYASEIAPLKLRGPIQSGLVLFTVLMQATGLGVVRAFVPDIRESSFRTVFAIQWAFGGLLMLAFLVVPESPVYLLKRNKVSHAEKAMSTLYGKDNAIGDRLAHLRKTMREENAQKELQTGTWAECFSGSNLKRSLTVMLIFATQNTCGAAFLAQSIYFLIIAGLPPINSFDIAIAGFFLGAIFIIVSWFALDKIGRRLMFIGGIIGNAVGMLIIGCLSYAPGTGPLWAIAVLMNLLISLQLVSIMATGWVITAEISSYRMRAKTQSIGVISTAFFTWLFQFIVPYIYNVDAGDLLAKTGFVFFGASILMATAAFFLIPNTVGMTTAEVDWMYNNKITVRHFRKHLDEARHQVGILAETEKAV